MPERSTFKLEGENPILFEGASAEVTIRESGEVTYKDEVPPEIPPLSVPGLHVRSSLTSVRPGGTSEEGNPVTYERSWSYTYVAASNADVAAALTQLYARIATPPE